MDFAGDAGAIAALYPLLTPPAGQGAVREASATPPATLAMLPAVYIFLDDSDLVTGHGVRAGVSHYLARFYLEESADLTRNATRLNAWATVLADVLKAKVQLAGRPNVARATVDGLKIALLPYSDRLYAGIESKITLVTSETWLASA